MFTVVYTGFLIKELNLFVIYWQVPMTQYLNYIFNNILSKLFSFFFKFNLLSHIIQPASSYQDFKYLSNNIKSRQILSFFQNLKRFS